MSSVSRLAARIRLSCLMICFCMDAVQSTPNKMAPTIPPHTQRCVALEPNLWQGEVGMTNEQHAAYITPWQFFFLKNQFKLCEENNEGPSAVHSDV